MLDQMEEERTTQQEVSKSRHASSVHLVSTALTLAQPFLSFANLESIAQLVHSSPFLVIQAITVLLVPATRLHVLQASTA